MDGVIGFMVMMYPLILFVLFLLLGPETDGKGIFGVSIFVWAMVWIFVLGCWLMEKGI